MDRGAWWAAVHRVAQSWTRLKWLSMHACIGEGNGSPLLYSCLENPRDRGAWWAAVYGVAQSQKWLKQLGSSSSRGHMHGPLIQWDWYLYERICSCFLQHVRAQSGRGPSPENNPAGPRSGTSSRHNCEKRNVCYLRHQYFMVFCRMVFGIWGMLFCYGNLSTIIHTYFIIHKS